MRFLFPGLLVALAGCAGGGSTVRSDGWAALGEAVQINGLTIAPERVIEDSRCPMNARCVTAGQVVLRVSVVAGSRSQSVDLTSWQPQQIDGGTLTLTSVAPERMAGDEIPPEEYRFAFEFDRKR